MNVHFLNDVAWLAAGLFMGAGGAVFFAGSSFSRPSKREGGTEDIREELKEARGLLREKSREIKTLEDTARAISSPMELSAALSEIVSIVIRHLEVDLVAFLLVDEAAQELVTQPGAHGIEREEQLYRISLLEERSSSVRVFKSGKPFVSGDAQEDAGVIHHYAKLWDIRSLIVVPIKRGGHSWGVMRVGSRKSYAFVQEHVDIMNTIAEYAGIVLEMAILNIKLIEDREQMRALSRMKDEFVSTVSHEFKTPLTTLAAFLGLMIEGDAGPVTKDQRRFIAMAQNAVKRLSNMVSDLLDISKLEGAMNMEMASFSISSLISAILETHALEAGAPGKAISFEVAEALPEAFGDQKWISTVIENLISNAIKFTKPNGRIAVKTIDKGDCLEVIVEDDGVGIPEEAREHIFEKFYRASNARELNISGTGLGLAISRKVIDLHAGRLWFESSRDRGTRFHFIVPSVNRYGEFSQTAKKDALGVVKEA